MTDYEARFRSSPLLVEPTGARPKLHLTPPQNWMNDPNGPFYMDGLWHLYYQHHPQGMMWGPMHWGHATSSDLLHWEHAEIALFPDTLGTIFSGCIVRDSRNTSGLFDRGVENGLVALFSYDNQTQGIAHSVDGGFTWTKYPENPILPAVKKDFRDPKVFWCPISSRWIMAIAADPECQFYSSSNLIDWTLESSFSDGPGQGVWEVPDLFPLAAPDGSTKWILLISIDDHAYAGGSGVMYFIGQWTGSEFVNDQPGQYRWLDHGPDNYAGTTFTDAPDGRRVYVGWMLNWVYANKTPQLDYRGTMTVPRDLFLTKALDGTLRLGSNPISLDGAFQDHKTLELDLQSGIEQVLAVGETTFGLTFKAPTLSSTVTVLLDPYPHATKATEVKLDPTAQSITVRRAKGCEEMFETAVLPAFETTHPALDVFILIDEGLVEIFDQTTGQTLSIVTYSGQRGSGHVVVQAEQRQAVTLTLRQ
ncbi:MAG: glycoside hydrolase family 32 protein [Alphaproteobacteria bacterium]